MRVLMFHGLELWCFGVASFLISRDRYFLSAALLVAAIAFGISSLAAMRKACEEQR